MTNSRVSKIKFYEITGPEYLVEMKSRLYGENNLIWIKQCRAIVEKIIGHGSTILDIGCGVGYLYKYFKDLKPHYYGIDGDQRLLTIAHEYYESEKNVKFIEHDISEAPVPIDFCHNADIVLCSAMLEHLPSLFPALNYIVKSASKIIYLRTFIGETNQIYYVRSPVSKYVKKYKKYINQYAYEDIFKYLCNHGYEVKTFRDEYTRSMPNLVNGANRSFYIIMGIRK